MFVSHHTLKWTRTCRSHGRHPHAHTAHFLLNRHNLEPADPALESEAVETAKNADVVLMFLGLPEDAESEGFDRDTLDMPAKLFVFN